MAPSTPRYGVYAAAVTFFNEDASLDLTRTLGHVQRMVESGIAGIAIQRSNSDLHPNHSERIAIARAIRAHRNEVGNRDIQLIVGCGAPTVQTTLTQINEAMDAGADFALVLPPTAWTAAMNVPLLEGFFCDIAAESSLPLLIYNFPGVTSGIDVSSDAIIRVTHSIPSIPSITGLKSPGANGGRLHRISATLWPYSTASGNSEILLDPLVGSQGVISMLANVAPKLHVQLLILYRAGDLEGAQVLETTLARASRALSKAGVAGLKAVIAHYFGYGSARAWQYAAHTTIGSLDEFLGMFAEVIRLEQSI